MPETIDHISDTAYWIAGYRALESSRTDAAFCDPYAALLAGERGARMVRETPHTEAMAFAMTVRTSAIDRLVYSAVGLGVHTVVNLAAGLDTRPYRLDLPAKLEWFEVDLPSVTTYKEDILRGEQPKCLVRRIAADLSDKHSRQRCFAEVAARSSNALVITEGLIGYLTAAQAKQLSEAIFATQSFRYWILDYARGNFKRNRQSQDLADFLKRTPIQFRVKEPVPFFEAVGWHIKENIFIIDEADRINRRLPIFPPWSYLMRVAPGLIRRLANRTYGYAMFGKQGSGAARMF